ncbi:MAG: bifunctional (p)ppGpp synthetase/guanosine-3',5'-bis(diphosphate) 3'-pyrophosphohydrolase [Desulfobulbaceae bacterium]|nr:bifunctional (p)ppGpp synthetase/guanosine-3',5'-bis(diphosphate) 3'-pyrophosphohydrolase [Desulfobulbaceae bacterium]
MQYEKFDIDGYRQGMAEIIGTGPETKVFWEALDFAYEAHKDQRRRSGDPYIMHPCSVARILAVELDIHSPEMLAAALLHDTIEDVEEVDGQLLREKFGPDVEAIVEGCTKVTHFSGGRQTFKKMVHRKIFSGAAAKLEVMLVKLADRLHNLRTLKSMPRNKRQKIADETLDIYAPLATILGLYDIKREMYNLALSHKFPRQSGPLRAHIKMLSSDPQALEIVNNVQKALEEAGVEANVLLRTKELWAYFDIRNRILMQEIESPQEFVILAENSAACYTALGVLNRIYPPTPRSIRDFIANPKPTGYQGLHSRPNINGNKYLFKIRTTEMSRRARRGMVRDWASDHKANSRFFEEIQEMFDILGSDESVSYRDMIAASRRKEIYTYTPQGELINLPINSIVLDFAFRIHSAIGLTCTGAMIGKHKVSCNHRLQDGNVVRIIRQEEPVVFEPEVQSLCQTAKARSELSKTFRLRREEVSRQIGASVLHQELRRYGIPREILEKDDMADVLSYFGMFAMPDLQLAVGEGRVRLYELIFEIRDCLYAGRSTFFQPTGVLNRVDLASIDPAVMKASACCRPSPLDKGIIGLLSERGLSLHRKDCPQLSKIKFQREDAVEVRWKLSQTQIRKPQKIIAMQAARNRLLMLLSVAPEEMRFSELIHLGKSTKTSGDWEITFRVNTLYGLKKVIRHFDRSGLPYEFELEA